MTPKQKQAVEFAKEQILLNDSHGHPKNHEYKTWEVIDHDWGKVEIRSEVGLIGDEGTYAKIFARTRRQIFIGPRGGYTLANPGKFVGQGDNIKKVARRGYVKGIKALWTVAA